MNTRRLLRNYHDQDMPYGGQVVDDSEYDPHWKDRLLPGNQEIIARQSHEEFIDNSASIVAGRYALRGAPGPWIRRPPGRPAGPRPRQGNPGPTATPEDEGTRRLSVTGFNQLV